MHFLTLTNTFSAHMQLELGRRVEDKYEQIHLFQLTRELMERTDGTKS